MPLSSAAFIYKAVKSDQLSEVKELDTDSA